MSVASGLAPGSSNRVSVKINGEERAVGRSFYRGSTANFMPHRRDMEKPSAIADFLLKGWMPAEPFVTPKTNIVAFGSCFAANIGKYLAGNNFNVATQRSGTAYVQTISDGLVNVFAICQQFEWAWENRVPAVELWHGWKAEDFGYDEDVRQATKKLFDEADVFILTFGLSEIWYDEPTGEVFWRAVPSDKFDASRHKFRVASYTETFERLQRIRELIRKHRPEAKIVFTLSPVGLAATFRPVACMTANSASKAILRTAIDELYRAVHAHDPDFFYFPSYEVVNSGFQVPFTEDLRHPARHVLDCNMKAFERYFCTTGLTDADLHKTIEQALEMDDILQGANEEQRLQVIRGASYEQRGTASSLEKDMKRRRWLEERSEVIERRQKAIEKGRTEKAAGGAARAERLKRREEIVALRAARAERLKRREEILALRATRTERPEILKRNEELAALRAARAKRLAAMKQTG